jgi:hypothetical protein
MILDKIPYQIGDGLDDYILFAKGGLSFEMNPGYKTLLEDSPMFDGSARINNFLADFKKDYEYTLKFIIYEEEKYTLDYVNKVFYGAPKKIFVYQMDYDGNIRVLYNYVQFLSAPEQLWTEDQPYGQKAKKISIKLRLLWPYWYECDDRLRYFDQNAFENNQLYWTPNPIQGIDNYWGTTTAYWGQTFLASFPFFSALSTKSRREILTADNPTCPLTYKDPIFAREEKNLSTNPLHTKTINLSSNAGSNLLNIYDLQSSAFNRMYLLEISALETNKYFTFYNLDTNSDLSITWLHSSNHTTGVVFNSFTGTLYDQQSGAQIPKERYVIDYDKPELLYFTNLLSINPYSKREFDALLIQKPTTTFSPTIKIQIVRTYN